MADDEKTKEQAQPEEKDKAENEKKDKKENDKKEQGVSLIGRILPWAIMSVIIIICAGSGFALARLFAGSRNCGAAEPNNTQQQENVEQIENEASTTGKQGGGEIWYYPFETIIANLDEPGAIRYLRVTLTLEMSPKIPTAQGNSLLDSKKPILTDWLTVYLGSLTIEDCTGKNKKVIQSQILDAFNEKLFPDAEPQIKRILFKEFNIQ